MFRRKRVEHYLREHQEDSLDSCLSLVDLVAYSISNMVGAGVFVVVGSATINAGGVPVVGSFFLAMLLCSFSGLAYAEFSRSIPTSGSAYAYTYCTLGEFPAFLVAHLLSLSCCIGAGIGARACAGYFRSLLETVFGGSWWLLADFPIFDDLVSVNLFAPLLVLILTWLQLRGARESADFNRLLVYANMGLMALFILLGLCVSDYERLHDEVAATSLGNVLTATGQVYYSFIGFDSVCLLSQEAQDASRTIPLALFLGLALVCVLYALVGLTLAGMQAISEISTSAPLSDAFLAHKLYAFYPVITLAAMTNTIATTFCGILVQPRLWMHVAADHLLPASLATVDHDTHLPVAGTLASGLIALLAAGLFEVNLLADVCSAGMLVAYSLLNVALLVARWCGVRSEYFRHGGTTSKAPARMISEPVDDHHDSSPSSSTRPLSAKVKECGQERPPSTFSSRSSPLEEALIQKLEELGSQNCVVALSLLVAGAVAVPFALPAALFSSRNNDPAATPSTTADEYLPSQDAAVAAVGAAGASFTIAAEEFLLAGALSLLVVVCGIYLKRTQPQMSLFEQVCPVLVAEKDKLDQTIKNKNASDTLQPKTPDETRRGSTSSSSTLSPHLLVPTTAALPPHSGTMAQQKEICGDRRSPAWHEGALAPQKEPDTFGIFFPWVTLIGLMANLCVMRSLGESAQNGLGLWCLFGAILYFSYYFTAASSKSNTAGAGSGSSPGTNKMGSSKSSTSSGLTSPLLSC
ncbi:unnamed protein product [Amoebophrya sp. A120]|nr:unnamed protein product [Amoebophrya sp. A120]|eukprot:GSA120T00017993001.1